MLPGDHPAHGHGHRPVVDGVDQLVGGAGDPQVDVEVDVDLERLGPVVLLGQGPVGPDRPQPPQLDPVAQVAQGFPCSSASDRARPTSSRPGGPIWRWLSCSTMEMADAGAPTRLAHTR